MPSGKKRSAALERSIVRTKTERFCTLVQYEDTVMVPESIFLSLQEIPLNWKEHMFLTGSSFNYTSILENGPWARGLITSEKHETSLFPHC